MMSAEYFHHVKNNSITVLATALVPIQSNGRSIILRALIDQRSTANLITNRACQTLGLPRTVGMALAKTAFAIGSVHNTSYRYDIKSIVVQTITSTQSTDLDTVNKWRHIEHLPLANPQFFKANKIDLLLGASTYAEIILESIKRDKVNEPIAQQIKMGWIVVGSAYVNDSFRILCNAINKAPPNDSDIDMSSQLEKFWQIEHVDVSKHLTPDEQTAEENLCN